MNIRAFYMQNFTKDPLLRHIQRSQFKEIVHAVFKLHAMFAGSFGRVDQVPDLLHRHGSRHFYCHMLAVLHRVYAHFRMVFPISRNVHQFLTLWNKRQHLKEVKDWDSYLFITVKHHAITFLEKNRQDNLCSIDLITAEIPGNDLTPEEKLLKKDMEEALRQAIKQLPEKTRLVYCMAKEEQMSYKQISEALDISERTVNTHMTNALRKLTESLQKYFK